MIKHGFIFIAAAVASLAYAIHFGLDGITQGSEMVALAENLARNGRFADPYVGEPTGPTAALPPLFPLYLALLFKVFGPHYGRWAALFLTTGIQGLHACLLLPVSRLLFGSTAPGFYGAALSIVLPAMRLILAWDAIYTSTALMFFFLLSAGAMRKLDPGPAGAVAGIIGGILLLLNPATIVIFGLCVIFRQRRPVFLAAAAAAMGLVCLPWIWRNYREMGAPALKNSFGINLYVSNNDCAQSSLLAEFDCHQAHHPAAAAAEASLLRSMGEVGYDRSRRNIALRWIGEHPRRFLELTAGRAVEFWFPRWEGGAYHRSLWLITILSGGGLLLMIRRREPATGLVCAILAIYPLIYYIVVADVRYRYPSLWVSLLTGGYLIAAAIDHWSKYRHNAQGRQG